MRGRFAAPMTADERAAHIMAQKQEDNYHSSVLYLLELTQREPTVVQAMHTLQSHALNGHICVKIDARPSSLRFQQFVNKHYLRFCEQAIFAMMTYGFIPWYKRKLANGNIVPTVLPPGTFLWKVCPVSQLKKELLRAIDKGKLLVYDITLQANATQLERKDVFIYEFETPVWEVGRHTINASVPSPLQNLVTTYRRLLDAMQNRAHADAWNSNMHIITKQASQSITQEPTATMFEAGRQVDSMYSYDQCQIQLHSRDDDIQNQFTKKTALHVPHVYTLPLNVSIEQTPVLRPCEDVQMLWDKFSRDVAMCFSLPPEALGLGANSSNRTTLHVQQHETLFNSMLSRLRRHLQFAMQDAYREIYLRGKEEGGRLVEKVEFELMNNNNVRLSSVEELAKLAAVEGALSPDMLREISQQMLYGNTSQRMHTQFTKSELGEHIEQTGATMKQPQKHRSNDGKPSDNTKKRAAENVLQADTSKQAKKS